ncbi:hypothetical protein ACIBCN_18690 [Nocardia sp. NPDC051052]|uniref:hypothetical protein n=1 Tax=Nocardia sp. NPDC051052 TaxID=3364322 RepID=UPI0037A611D5
MKNRSKKQTSRLQRQDPGGWAMTTYMGAVATGFALAGPGVDLAGDHPELNKAVLDTVEAAMRLATMLGHCEKDLEQGLNKVIRMFTERQA